MKQFTEQQISVIGAGQVGATTALKIIENKLAEKVVLLDVIDGLPQGKALDLAQSGYSVKVTGSNDYANMEGSDIVIITAGVPRKPGMSRSDLIGINANIIKDVVKNVVAYAKNSFIIAVTNPLDVMTYLAYKASKFPSNKVMGMSGVLDTFRFKTFISLELNVAAQDVQALVLGGHGDSMVPITRYCTVGGVPLTSLLPQEAIDKIVERTRNGGAEIVGYLKTGSAFYSPAESVTLMVASIVHNQRRLLPVSAYLNGEYGAKDLFIGVPAILGKNGVEKVIELELTDQERSALQKSMDDVLNDIKKLEL